MPKDKVVWGAWENEQHRLASEPKAEEIEGWLLTYKEIDKLESPVNNLWDYRHWIKVGAKAQLAKVKEAGWIDPATVIMPGEFGTPKAEQLLAQWAKASGYVKLTPTQLHILDTCSGHHL